MTLANWMILAAALLPYLTVVVAKAGAPGFDNAAVRPSLEQQQGYRQRADWAHRNHFEAFAPFAAAVILAQAAGAAQGRIDLLAFAFVLLRLAYTGAYLAGIPRLRTALFLLGFACVVWLFLLPLSAPA
ncbi:MAPEG family protein [Roseomonas marmotae]|uniref:MAPEG family protein n=1 Tax=Roseomonas marmotae TaxID=2768161 RepID=A0ABS3KDM3_9PROT|nr:MAPEG family protein [Roseomonas marmotae]MBO1075564.1 MAPEG family protein [Roseomonas marmotae]QTI79430.1 MAPEG family protein [Roseomonas marmotae]